MGITMSRKPFLDPVGNHRSGVDPRARHSRSNPYSGRLTKTDYSQDPNIPI